MNTRLGIIYCATNKITGKVYIGQTGMDSYAKRRKEHYMYSIKKNRREWKTSFHQAIREYDWSSFEWSILYSAVPEEYINLVESLTIIKYDSLNNGYNNHAGGRTVNVKSSQKLTEEELQELLKKWEHKK